MLSTPCAVTMSASHDFIRGPFVKHAFAKSVTKGEDFWLQQRGVEAGPTGKAKAPSQPSVDQSSPRLLPAVQAASCSSSC